MTNQEIIHILKSATFLDEDGEEFNLYFHVGLSELEISKLGQKFPGGKISQELSEILKITKGWEDMVLEYIDFTAINLQGFETIFPYSITIGYDTFGNAWILEIDAAGNMGHVFYASHDPAVIIKQSENLNEFLQHLLDFYKNPKESHLDNIYDNYVDQIWEDDSHFLLQKDFEAKNQMTLKFLNNLEGDWVVADLRSVQNGVGFPYGKFGPNQPLVKHPDELIWAIDKTPKTGFINWIFE